MKSIKDFELEMRKVIARFYAENETPVQAVFGIEVQVPGTDVRDIAYAVLDPGGDLHLLDYIKARGHQLKENAK